MARRGCLLLSVSVKPCRGWIPHWSSCLSNRACCLTGQKLVPTRRSLSVGRQAVESGEPSPGRFRWTSEAGWYQALGILEDRYGEQYNASQITWDWWIENIKGSRSAIDVTCQTCGHRSKSTSLQSLKAGKAPGCFCNGGVPWSSREGHERCLLMLQERYGEQYDASQMTWDWWRENIKGSRSAIDVTCQTCGHRSKSTSLNNLNAGRAPGCFCNGGVPWSSREGHERCLLMLQERYGEQYDASQMTWDWWRGNIKNQDSTIDVTCQTCGHRSKGTSLSSLQSGNAPGCFCNRGVPWSSRAGHERCLLMLQERYGVQYDASQMTWDWWRENIKGSRSAIDVTCRTCGHRSKSTSLQSLKAGKAPGCFCNGGVPWSSREGHERCLLMLQERYGEQYDASQITWDWWRENIKGSRSAIEVTCRTCGHRSKSTSLQSLKAGQAPGCFCNRGVPWSSRAGHERCLLMLQERYGEQYDASQMTWDWWRENIKGSSSAIDVTCQTCEHRSQGTSLNRLQQGNSPGCFCNKKTEAKLGRYLFREYPDSIITSQVRGCTNPDTGRPLPFDFGLYHDSILIELDGDIGHFGRGFGGDPDDQGVPQRDFHKEHWAMRQGKVVVRLLQTDVYQDSWPWVDFLTSAIQHATCSTQPCVITQAAKKYKGGIYRQLRRDLNCKEGLFLPSRIPYLKYRLARARG